MKTPISFEFFPPNTEAGLQKLQQVREQLRAWQPEFFSVTYGAGGVTRDKTLAVVLDMARQGIAVAPHISCIGADSDSVSELLSEFKSAGIKRLVALRGDLPSGMVDMGDFRYASDLVSFIRTTTGSWFDVSVAAYPEVHPHARSATDDLAALAKKFEAGANRAITQFFFSAEAFLNFRDQAHKQGIRGELVPGIMPIHDLEKISRFAANCGAEIPRWLSRQAEYFEGDAAGLREFLDESVARLCRTLIREGVPGLHLYTLNRFDLSHSILTRL
jgi:methylenetetrahydrofolate reductase (NADPH)